MIEGKRIILRAREKPDLPTFVRWFNDAEVTVFLANAYPSMSLEQEERWYEENKLEKYGYCIVVKEGNVPIGTCGLHDLDWQHRSAEVGIVIGEKAYWSQGYGREALGLLQEVAFEGLGLHRLWLRCLDLNARGQRCYRAAGFTEEARLRQASFVRGAFHDMVVMAMLAHEYQARKAQRV